MYKKILRGLAYLAVMLTLGFIIYYLWLNPNSPLKNSGAQNADVATKALFASNLQNENGVSQALSQYQGKIIVLNFWATWCPPCREEMPELSQLHTENAAKNVVVLGVAIDTPELVKAFSVATPVSYPLFSAEDEGMALSSQLGNDKGALPYTVIIDTHGKVVKTHFGRVTKPLLQNTLKTLIH